MNIITRDRIKDIVLECIENRFDKDNKNTILKCKPFDGELYYIYKDFNLDSLDIIELIIEIEYLINEDIKKYNKNIHIEDQFINKELTISQLIDYLYNKANN